MSQFQSKIRPNFDPESVWSTSEINKTFVDLDNIIGTSLEQVLLQVGTTQAVQGQKTFTNMYMTTSSSPYYENMLAFLQNEISPVINTGAKGISTDVVKELASTKSNVSGVIASIATLNSVFRDSLLEIFNPNGTSVTITANNIPLAAYDNAKLGTPPVTSSNQVGAFYWPTSKGFASSTTVDFANFLGGTTDGRYEIILAYNDGSNSFAPFVVKEGSEVLISTDNKSFRRVGFFRILSGNIISFRQVGGEYYLAPFIDDTTGSFLPADWIKSHCIITFIVTPSSGQESVQAYPSQDLYFINNATGGNIYGRDTMMYEIPMIYDNGFPGFSFKGAASRRTLVRISFGTLL
jgi:hypothetical protein